MNLTRHKDGYRIFCEKTLKGIRHRKTGFVKNKTEAKVFESEFISQLNKGKKNPTMRLDLYGQNYIDNLDGLEQRTIDSYQCAYNRIKPYIKFKLNSFDNDQWIGIYNKLKNKDLAPRSIKHTFRILNMICNQAELVFGIKMGHGTFKHTVKLQVEDIDPPKSLDLDQQQLLMNYLTDHKEKNEIMYQTFIFCLIGLYTGMRTGEIGALTWKDIDLFYNTIDINKAISKSTAGEIIKAPKTKNSIRNISVHDIVVKELKAYKEHLELIGDVYHLSSWLFNDPGNIKIHAPITVWSKRVPKVMNDIGISGFSAHSLRHTHASNLLMNNCPLIQVAHRLGHKDASVTLKVYSHFVKKLAVDFNEYMPKIHA